MELRKLYVWAALANVGGFIVCLLAFCVSVVALYVAFNPPGSEGSTFMSLNAVLWTLGGFMVAAISVYCFAARTLFRATREMSSVGFVIESAKWYCTVFPEYFEDLTTVIQNRAYGKDRLELRAHQDAGWGDVCQRHPGPGHHKTLEVKYTYHGHSAISYDTSQVIPFEIPGSTSLLPRAPLLPPKEECVLPTKFRILTFQRSWYSPSKPDNKDFYRHKVNFVMTNGGDDIEIWTPLWESKEGVLYQSPLASALFPEGPKGHLADDWLNQHEGLSCIKLKTGQSFKGWIGLMPSHGEGLQVRVDKHTTGTLIFPIKLEGRLTYERVDI
jgi:hypothetical protein